VTHQTDPHRGRCSRPDGNPLIKWGGKEISVSRKPGPRSGIYAGSSTARRENLSVLCIECRLRIWQLVCTPTNQRQLVAVDFDPSHRPGFTEATAQSPNGIGSASTYWAGFRSRRETETVGTTPVWRSLVGLTGWAGVGEEMGRIGRAAYSSANPTLFADNRTRSPLDISAIAEPTNVDVGWESTMGDKNARVTSSEEDVAAVWSRERKHVIAYRTIWGHRA